MFGTCDIRYNNRDDFLRMRLFHKATSEVAYLEKYVLPKENPFDDNNFRIRLTPVGVTQARISE